jgi:hypothetical protein
MNKKMEFKNKFDATLIEKDWLNFEYEIGWNFHTNEPKCFAGDHLTTRPRSCTFWCADKQCTLENPHPSQNSDSGKRRMLQTATNAGRDITGPKYNPEFLRDVPKANDRTGA